MKVLIVLLIMLSLIFIPASIRAEESSKKELIKKEEAQDQKPLVIENLNKLCAETYLNEATCPKNFCKLFCLEGESSQNCTLTCEPRPCIELSAEYCPQDTCQILDGCGDVKRCFAKLADEPSQCGDLAYTGNLECCPGLIKRCGVEFFDGSCDMKAEYSVEGVPACIPCGNGICNQFENRCNCPEDCSEE